MDYSIQRERFRRLGFQGGIFGGGNRHVTDVAGVSGDTELADRFPYYTPTKASAEDGTEVSPFPEETSYAEFWRFFRRWQLARVIVCDVVEDALRSGFYVSKVDDPENREFDSRFQVLWENHLAVGFERTAKLARLLGSGALYYGSKGVASEGLTSTLMSNEIVEWLLPLARDEFELSVSDDLPRMVENISLGEGEELRTIDRTRFVWFEHGGLRGDREGMSALEPIRDLLAVQKCADWSIGQDMWRGASGLLTLFSPPGTTSATGSDALSAVDNIHAKSRLVLPPGFDAKDLTPARTAYKVKDSYVVLAGQIAAGCRLPASLLYPDGARPKVLDPEYIGFLFSLQQSFLSPALRECFEKFQFLGTLPSGDFRIIWNPVSESPHEAAKERYMHAISGKLEKEVEVREVGRDLVHG